MDSKKTSLSERIRYGLSLPIRAFYYLRNHGLRLTLINADNRLFRLRLLWARLSLRVQKIKADYEATRHKDPYTDPATLESVPLGSYPGRFDSLPGWRMLVVSHDAFPSGAQGLLLRNLEWFRSHTSISIKVLCLGSGKLLPRFEALADTILLEDLQAGLEGDESAIRERLLEFCGGQPDLIYANSVASGRAFTLLQGLEAPILTHVHEMEMSIQHYAADCMPDVLRCTSLYIAASQAVKDNLVKNHGVDPRIIEVVHVSIPDALLPPLSSSKEIQRRKKQLRLDSRKIILLGCGQGLPFRKGADLFIDLGQALLERGRTDFHMYWVGGFEQDPNSPQGSVWADRIEKMRRDGLSDAITFLGARDNAREYIRMADVFVLPSREDPQPLVALEAAMYEVPTVCFADAGGTPDLVGEDAGFVVPLEDVQAMADRVIKLMNQPHLRTSMGRRAREKFLHHFTIEATAPKVLAAARRAAGRAPAVSIIVPNYNHEKFLPVRLDTIFGQSFQDFEVIILDDASRDKSLEVIEGYTHLGDVRVVRNEQNSGSAFRQWLKGIDLARAEILWIAESDDLCAPNFLEILLPSFRDLDVKLAYANSHIINEKDEVLGDYPSTEYLASLSTEKWMQDYTTPAEQEINDGLGVKNTILNISSALIRGFELEEGLREVLQEMTIAGDWYFIAQAIRDGSVAYDSRKLNSHRRHSSSVIAQTVSERRLEKFFEEFHIVQGYIVSHYPLSAGFTGKWENYLRKQWADFCPGLPFEELERYYPFKEMKTRITRRAAERG